MKENIHQKVSKREYLENHKHWIISTAVVSTLITVSNFIITKSEYVQ